MSQTTALYRLQKIDLELETRRSRVREIKAALEQNEDLCQAQSSVESLQTALRPQETRVKDLNLALKTNSEQSAQLTERLYSGKVSNPKELQDIQDKIAELKRRHADLENSLLETMIAIEELQEKLDSATAHLAQVEAEWAEKQQTLTEERQHLRREIKALKTDRETAVADTDEHYLNLYDTLRAQKQGHAVSVLQGEICSICGVRQTTTLVQQVRQNQGLITCSSCGRILIAL